LQRDLFAGCEALSELRVLSPTEFSAPLNSIFCLYLRHDSFSQKCSSMRIKLR
jgi:hypothetical protein